MRTECFPGCAGCARTVHASSHFPRRSSWHQVCIRSRDAQSSASVLYQTAAYHEADLITCLGKNVYTYKTSLKYPVSPPFVPDSSRWHATWKLLARWRPLPRHASINCAQPSWHQTGPFLLLFWGDWLPWDAGEELIHEGLIASDFLIPGAVQQKLPTPSPLSPRLSTWETRATGCHISWTGSLQSGSDPQEGQDYPWRYEWRNCSESLSSKTVLSSFLIKIYSINLRT